MRTVPAIPRASSYLAVGAAYLLCLILFDRLGGRLQVAPGQGLWNPYPGLSLALLFLFGLRFLPFLAVRPWVSYVWVFHLGDSLMDHLVFATLSMAPFAAAAAVLRASPWMRRHGPDLAGMMAFTLAGLGATALEAGLTLGYAAWRGLADMGGTVARLPAFWLAEGLGMITLAPLIWMLRSAWDRRREAPPPGIDLRGRFRGGRLEAVLMALGVLLAFWVAFAAPFLDRKPSFYPFFIPLLWIALRRGALATALALLAVNAGILYAVRGGVAPSTSWIDLQVFLGALAVSSLLLGARTSESLAGRRRIEADARLLDVVRRVQARFIEESTLPRHLFEELLGHLLALSGSRYDFLCEADEREPERFRVVAEIGWDAARGVLMHEMHESSTDSSSGALPLRRLFADHLAGGKPALVNDVEAELGQVEFPAGAPGARNLLVLPLTHDGVVVGLLGLADRPGGFDHALLDYLEPVVGAAASMVAAHRQKRRRERAERALQESERRFRLLVEGVRDYAIFSLDADGRIASWNRGAERIKGYAAEEILGRPYSTLFGEQDRATGLPDTILETARREGRYRGQGWRMRKDGTAYFTDARVTAIRDGSGVLLGYSIVTRDVTELRAMQDRTRSLTEALEDRVRELEALLEVVPVGIAFLDRGESRLRSWNPAYASIFRLPGGSAETPSNGQDGHNGAAGADPGAEGPRVLEEGRDVGLGDGPLHRAVSLGRPVLDRQLELRFPGGETRTLLASAVPLSDGEGKVRGGVGLFMDITEKLRTGAALERTAGELRQSRKLEEVGHIAGGVAHDFNNLLTAINGYAELALSALPDGAPVRAHLGEIRKAGERAGDLTRQLLVFSRRQDEAPESLEANSLVEGMAGLLRRVIPESVRIRLALDPRAGAVVADRNQVERIVLNLAVNARDAMPEGGTLTLETRRAVLPPGGAAPEGLAPGEYVVLGVADTGTGIVEAARPHVFEAFFTTKPEGKGTGLGLAMVRQMVEDMGGGIDFETAEGLGTRFDVYLPAAVTDGSAPGAATQTAPAASPVILVVDDEEPLRSFLRLVLEGRGYSVLEAAGGEEALRLAGESPVIDLLISDVVMPGMGGRELAGRLKAERPRLPVIFISGYTDDQAIGQAYLEPYATLLPKPFTPAALLERVREALGAAVAG